MDHQNWECRKSVKTFLSLSNGGQKRRGKRQAVRLRQKQRGSVGCLCVFERKPEGHTHTHEDTTPVIMEEECESCS